MWEWICVLVLQPSLMWRCCCCCCWGFGHYVYYLRTANAKWSTIIISGDITHAHAYLCDVIVRNGDMKDNENALDRSTLERK